MKVVHWTVPDTMIYTTHVALVIHIVGITRYILTFIARIIFYKNRA